MNDAVTAQNRVTIALTPRAQDAAETAMRLTGLNKTDVINRALVAYAYIEKAIAEGAQIIVTRETGSEVVQFL